MIRTQISFDEEQYEALQAAAEREGVSMAALVRDAVDEKLRQRDEERERKKRRALSVIGMFRGTGENVSEDHDRYLDEAYGDW
ncbi:MAG TPA: CopG family transcriptional regulator [Candidatus Limnocylindria bacterium]|nr:CopG family transcriptional regulator [Candidatus Limnocylindria bacterium]